MLLSDLRFLFIDVQTTGASPRHGHLLELAWCFGSAGDDGLHLAEASLVCRLALPPLPIPRQVSRVTGIAPELLLGAGTAAAAVLELEQAAAGTNLALAHVARFEASFLQDLWRSTEGGGSLPWPFLCTHAIAKRLLPSLPSLSLRAVAGHFGHALPRERRAGPHALATAAVWRGLFQLLRHEAGVSTLAELSSWLTQPPPKASRLRSYPLAPHLRLSLPDRPGIYRFRNSAGQILYIGKAQSLKARVNSYFRQRRGHAAAKLELLAQVVAVETEEAPTAVEAALLESDEIKRVDPPYNIALRALGRRAHYFDPRLQLSPTPTEPRLYGPYGRSDALHMVTALAAVLASGEGLEALVAPLFSAAVDQACAVAGLHELMLELQLPPQPTPRQLLARTAWLERRRAAAAAAADEEEQEPAVEDEASARTQAEPTPLAVRERLLQALLAAARAWLRGRSVQQLLWSDIAWQEAGEPRWRQLQVRAGAIVARAWAEAALDDGPAPAAAAPFPTDIVSYDRMRVLLTELNRLRSSGQRVMVRRCAAI